MISKKILGVSIAAALSSGMSYQALSAEPAQIYQPQNKRRSGHWEASVNCKKPAIARAKAKRAKQARKLHR